MRCFAVYSNGLCIGVDELLITPANCGKCPSSVALPTFTSAERSVRELALSHLELVQRIDTLQGGVAYQNKVDEQMKFMDAKLDSLYTCSASS